jgi:hypothetical protein
MGIASTARTGVQAALRAWRDRVYRGRCRQVAVLTCGFVRLSPLGRSGLTDRRSCLESPSSKARLGREAAVDQGIPK